MFRLLLFIFLTLPLYCSSQIITTVAGNGQLGNSGDGGTALNAAINYPVGGAIDNHANYYFALGVSGNTIRKVTPSGMITTVVGNGTSGFSGDGSLALNAQLSNPQAVILDSLGNIFIADANNQRIRRVDHTTGVITTIAGNGTVGFNGDGISALQASLYTPIDLCFDNIGNMYIVDATNYRIRKINLSGIISTVVGTGTPGHTGDNGPADLAEIIPSGICTDSDGNILIADSYSIRRFDVSSGLITKIVGTGINGSSGDGGMALNAQVTPNRITIDKLGNLFIIDADYHKIRMVNSLGIISTVVGNGIEGFSGDGNLAILAELDDPFGIVTDTCGNLFIADGHNRRIRKIDFNPNCWPVSVNEHTKLSFNLYPNPTNTHLTITGENLQSITITNTLGQIAHSQKAAQEKTVVDISALNAGVYFVTVTDKQGVKVTKKVVKE